MTPARAAGGIGFADERTDREDEAIRVDRFADAVFEAGGVQSPAIDLGKRRHRDRRNVRAASAAFGLHRPHSPQDGESVLLGHCQVEQQRLRLQAREHPLQAREERRSRSERFHRGAALSQREPDDVARIRIVVHQEDRESREPRGAGGLLACGRQGASLLQARRRRWQVDGEHRAAAHAFALCAHLAAVQLDQMAYERETDAEPAGPAGRRGIRLREPLEHVGQELGRNAGTVVAHGEPDAIAARAAPSSRPCPAAA